MAGSRPSVSPVDERPTAQFLRRVGSAPTRACRRTLAELHFPRESETIVEWLIFPACVSDDILLSSRASTRKLGAIVKLIMIVATATALLGCKNSSGANDNTAAKPAPAAAPSVPKVAFVSYLKAADETNYGKEMAKQLQDRFKERQQKLEKLQQSLAKEQQLLQSGKVQPTKKRVARFQKQAAEFQQSGMELQAEQAKALADMKKEVTEKLEQFTKEIANKHGFDMVIRKEAVAFGNAELDVTDELLALTNERLPGDSALPTPGAFDAGAADAATAANKGSAPASPPAK